ncbi:MAG: AbrB/MazE/SpoVT family DNA-binding domain-containing protein [Acidobacteriota bacterium]
MCSYIVTGISVTIAPLFRYNHIGMTRKIKLTKVGSSLGVEFPKEVVDRLRVQRGDTLYVVETPNGIELTPYDPEFDEQLSAANQVLQQDHEALGKLAQ